MEEGGRMDAPFPPHDPHPLLLTSSRQVVMYLDTDCGQPEFTPPGQVAMVRVTGPVVGPPCVHMQLPVASHFLVRGRNCGWVCVWSPTYTSLIQP
jgi:hypothetical protein